MTRAPDPLADYNAKRDFTLTDEPSGERGEARTTGLRFLVQKHDASRLHYDLRLEWDGVLLSWAVTKGPSDDPGEKRLAVRTEDHPLSYGTFEGTIPAKNYGAGTVMMWDEGIWLPETNPADGLAKGKLAFTLMGERMQGSWALVRMRDKGEKRENWLLIKHRDSAASETPDRLTESHDTSVTTGRTMAQIASGAKAKPRKDKPARTGKRPAFRKPQLATLVAEPPDGDDWLFETKFDGYRCLAALGKGGTRLWTRNGNDWTDRFKALDGAFDPLPCDAALIDGEVMARNVSGSAFSSLQSALKTGRPLVFFAFDLLSLNGTDLTKEPQTARKARLTDLLAGLPDDGPLRLSTHIAGGGPDIFRRACEAGAEGIIAKRATAPYRGQRSTNWLKVKCTRRQEFVVGGYSPSDKAGRPFASLLVGEQGPDGLRYRGRIGSGFSEADFDELTKAFRHRKTSPFDAVPDDIAASAQWVTPAVVAEVDFAELTDDGQIRHGVYLGRRRDKAAEDITLETPKDVADDDDTPSDKIGGVSISNANRVIFPQTGRTKGDLARYYAKAAPRLREIAGHRPLSLLRLPEGMKGTQFFQKHAGQGMPDDLNRIEITESDGDVATYMDARRESAFVAAAQMGTIEFHIWGARTDRLDRPDRMVFDLDPDEAMGWPDVRSAAFDVAARLDALGLASVPVVTGGKGVHVCVCLRRTKGWDTVKLFTKTLAHVMAQAEPDRFTATMSKAKRKGRIFIDWLRNERGATAIAPYSVRARPTGPVAIPVTWDELESLAGPATFDQQTAAARLDQPCPYLEALAKPQSLTAKTIDTLGKSLS